MAITFYPAKRDKALAERGMDFLVAGAVFARLAHQFEGRRIDYSEIRFITVGLLNGRMVIVGWTRRGTDRHVLTMRKANAREQALYRSFLR